MTMTTPYPWIAAHNAYQHAYQQTLGKNTDQSEIQYWDQKADPKNPQNPPTIVKVGTQIIGDYSNRYSNEKLAVKFDSDKLQWDLFPFDLAEDELRVWMFGAKKYSAHNWRKGMPMSRGFNALMRHLTAYMNGEDNDPESNYSHLAHAACCLKMMQHTEKHHPELDDRRKHA